MRCCRIFDSSSIMAGVNLLCQCRRILGLTWILEYTWAHRSREARENELRWRVKENVVATAISFIWYDQRGTQNSSCLCIIQDLDTICDSALFVSMLHSHCREGTHGGQSIHGHCSLRAASGADDYVANSSVCDATWYVNDHTIFPLLHPV
jgi:hypothetical protein